MSFVTDSPVHSSSGSDDFAAFLESTLDSKSSDSSPDEEAATDGHSDSLDSSSHQEAKNDSNIISKRPRLEIIEETLGSTFNGFVEQHLGETRGSTSNGFLELPLGETQEPTSNGFVEQHLEASWKKDICKHPGSFGEMCILCGKMLETEAGVALRYIHKELRLNNDEIVRLRTTDMKNLRRRKKLYLVLDLDHTLLNSTQLIHLTAEEEYLKEQADSLQDMSEGSLFKLNSMHMMTKLRPFVHTFLKEASKMFEMYIYTMGERSYALEMAKLLDPRKEYFDARVISRDDGTEKHQKGLDVILGQDSAVLILDDMENAWTKHKDNLILMDRYLFFASSFRQFGFNCKSLSELKSDESVSDGALSSVLKVLRRIHFLFFDELGDNVDGRDVRQVLKTVRKEVLKNCKLVFSHVFPTKFQAEKHHLWKMAEQLGAYCSTELDQTVTHVVSTDAGTEKSRWAVKEKKFLVHPRWIEAANYLWQRQLEENFTLDQLSVHLVEQEAHEDLSLLPLCEDQQSVLRDSPQQARSSNFNLQHWQNIDSIIARIAEALEVQNELAAARMSKRRASSTAAYSAATTNSGPDEVLAILNQMFEDGQLTEEVYLSALEKIETPLFSRVVPHMLPSLRRSFIIRIMGEEGK